MLITDVRVFLRGEEKLKAYITITIDQSLVIHNVKVIQGHTGLVVCMPSRQGKDGVFRDVCHPINKEFRKEIDDRVLLAYEDAVKSLTVTTKS